MAFVSLVYSLPEQCLSNHLIFITHMDVEAKCLASKGYKICLKLFYHPRVYRLPVYNRVPVVKIHITVFQRSTSNWASKEEAKCRQICATNV